VTAPTPPTLPTRDAASGGSCADRYPLALLATLDPELTVTEYVIVWPMPLYVDGETVAPVIVCAAAGAAIRTMASRASKAPDTIRIAVVPVFRKPPRMALTDADISDFP